MVIMIETGILGLILLALAIVFGAFIILKSIKNFLLNAAVGLTILFLANAIAGLNRLQLGGHSDLCDWRSLGGHL